MTRRYPIDLEAVGITLVILALILVSYLNGGRSHEEKLEKIRACGRLENPTACIQAVDR